MKRHWLTRLAIAALLFPCFAFAQYVTLTGTLQSSNGLPATNLSIAFTPSQFGYIAGTGVVVNTTSYCATSIDGSTVWLLNPLAATINTPNYIGGTLTANNYYVRIAWYDSLGHLTLPSPESTAQLTMTGNLRIAPPAGGMPAGSLGMKVYIGLTSGGETLQGTQVGSGVYTQSIPLVSGAALPTVNNTVCKEVANDAIWPVGTGYQVSLTDPSGNTLPGYPMMWQLNGPNSTIDLSTGLPYYHGVVVYPSPILASPYSHGQQSISGPLSLGSYFMLAGGYGIGVLNPQWGLDLEGAGNYAIANANGGYLYNGAAPNNHLLLGNGTAYVDSATIPASAITGLFYQTVDSATVAQTQRQALNFSSNFTLSDSASPSRTNVDLSTTGISAGACNQPTSVTYDTFGRASSCTSGGGSVPVSKTCTGTVGTPPWACFTKAADGTLHAWGVTTASISGSTVGTGTITFPNTGGNAFSVNPSMTVTIGDYIDPTNNAQMAYFASLSTSGATAVVRCAVNIGGSGCNNVTTTVPVHFDAWGQ